LLLLSGRAVYAQDDAGDLLGRINNLRASLGRAPYSLNGALSGAAQDQAQWIVNTGNVSHTREDGSGPRTRALAYGYGTTDVSENIYGGSNATVNDAWTFWVNSGIHYRGLVNERFQQVGIGIARGGWGAAFVLVFGNPGGPPPAPPAPPPGSNGGGGSSAPAAAPEQPLYVVGLDANGNIMHEVQPGDTLGDILLIYGYTWDMLPYIQQINGIGDVRDLEIGSILLVPPYTGTYTPTPNTELPTAESSPTFQYPTPFPEDPLFALSQTPPPSATPADAMMVAAVPTVIGTQAPTDAAGTQVSALPTPAVTITPPQTEQGQGIPTWLLIGIGLQVVIVLGAAFEFSRRLRRK
jgi:hypothetical protein